jgi:hypothetical protein
MEDDFLSDLLYLVGRSLEDFDVNDGKNVSEV